MTSIVNPLCDPVWNHRERNSLLRTSKSRAQGTLQVGFGLLNQVIGRMAYASGTYVWRRVVAALHIFSGLLGLAGSCGFSLSVRLCGAQGLLGGGGGLHARIPP